MDLIKIIIIGSDLANKTFFLVTGIRRLIKIKKDMKVDKKYLLYSGSRDTTQFQKNDKKNWTFFSMTKFILNKLLTLLYFSSIIIYFLNYKEIELKQAITFTSYYAISCITWLLSIRVFYKEYRIYKDQTWNGIRIFWILNIILNIIQLVYIFFDDDYKKFYKNNLIIFILFAIICLISFILCLFAIFHPYDVIIKKKNKEKEKNKAEDNATNTSTGVQEDLLFNSEDEFTNEEEISFNNMETIIIELNDHEGFNMRQFTIELKIKTIDFKQLIFSLKIGKIKHKRTKMPINVSNFNEVVLKHYKNKNVAKDILNLLKQAYNISLTLNPQRNSFSCDNKNINLLAHLYREIIKKDYQFLLDLLKFLKIKSDDLINSLSESFTSIFEENPSVEKEIERIDTLGSIFDNFGQIGFIDISHDDIKKQKTTNKNPKIEKKFKNNDDSLEIGDPFFSLDNNKTSLKKNLFSKDYASLSSFLNNILINKRFITIQIISYEEISQNINLILKSSSDKNGIVLQLNIDIIHDVLYDDELSSYIIDNAENLNNQKSNAKQTLEELFNGYLNNIFYYDEKLYNVFNLNELIKLEMDQFNNEIIQKFFEEKKCNLDSDKDDIREFSFDMKFKNYKDNNDLKSLINEGIIEVELSKTYLKEKIIDKNVNFNCKINIIKFYLIIENMIFVLNKKVNKYNVLVSTLKNIIIYSGKLLNIIYKIEENKLKNIKNYRIKEVVYGDKKIIAIVDEFEKKFANSKIQINNINQAIINDINKEIKNLNVSLNSILNKPNLKYALYFTCFRDLIEFSSLF